MEIRELTRLEQLEWLKDTLERELIGILEELDECNKEMVGSDEPVEEFGVDTAVTDLIKRGWENIDTVNSIKATFESLPDDVKTALDCILDDNMIHIGLLEKSIGVIPTEEVEEKEEKIELEEV